MPVEHAGQHSPGHQTTPLRIRSWAGRLERDLPKVTQGHWTAPAYWEPQVPDSALHVPRLNSQRPGKPLSPGKVRAVLLWPGRGFSPGGYLQNWGHFLLLTWEQNLQRKRRLGTVG